MKILGLDTSSRTASVAVVDNGEILAEYTCGGVKKYAETLLPMVELALDATGFSLEDLDCIACSNGPGSFTGLRIAATTAKGLAFAANKPLVAVSTLDAMAFSSELANLASFVKIMKTVQNANLWVVPMLDARREQAYSAFYCNGNLVGEYIAENVVDIVSLLQTKMQSNDFAVFLPDTTNIAKILNDLEKVDKFPKSLTIMGKISAASVANCALTKWESLDKHHESNFSLMYIRKPQAEREKEEREKQAHGNI
ncbi:MAG: tRNA (adenosine(37)-N6)-threonylcarbamoyltransferase complex dimerization subunit type 1 TsaB [Firmicutes bacterium]|nr:tRNA (adenosine(37)-N6)-threonylcarbamoyltransferase complex dimerization subunit type 1 TsaB [Bacillota bacterium]